jgi:putative polyketide hydroxylase
MNEKIPVLIAGAGPAGLAAAMTLARLGIRALVVERRTEIATLPRATGISTRTNELLRSWGLHEHVNEGAPEIEWLLLEAETMTRAAAGTTHEVGFPTRAQQRLVSPTGPACVAQDRVERVLMEALGAGAIERGTELTGLELRPGGVSVELGDRTIHARYLIGADGGRSTVRELLGIAMHGPGDVAESIGAQFTAPLWEVAGEHRYVVYTLADGYLIPGGAGDRWIYGREPEPGVTYTEQRMTELIREAAGVPDLPLDIETVRSVTFTAELADRFRSGNAFLIGDAAHRVSPRGATGLNTAVHDGFDLGWRLGWVLRGWAPPELLDGYEAERRPVAAHQVERSADPMGSRRSAGELQIDLGGRIPHLWVEDGVSTLDLLGRGLTLFRDGPARPAPAAGGRAPVTVRELDPLSARALGVPAGGALLVRPDGRPVESWTSVEPGERRQRHVHRDQRDALEHRRLAVAGDLP